MAQQHCTQGDTTPTKHGSDTPRAPQGAQLRRVLHGAVLPPHAVPDLGFGRIVASEIDVPNMLVNVV